jgi:O-antigen/teichoic acid export membrane protein
MIPEDKLEYRGKVVPPASIKDWFAHWSRLRLPSRLGIPQRNYVDDGESHVSTLRKLMKSSGIYILASVASPLISLVLAPFLTHNLSPSDFGILTITNTSIALTAGIAQLGLASAFFRAYSYDFSSQQDKRDVVATATTLLCLSSMLVVIVLALMSSTVAHVLFGRSTPGNYIVLACGVVLLQNLTVPGMAWLRAESRAFAFTLLSISNVVVTLAATIYLLGVLHWGVSGAIIANGAGYGFIVICTLPIIILRAGLKIRIKIMRNLLSFGLPLVLNFVAYWILQFSDRYLLGLFTSLAETARYAVAYSLGSALSVVIMGPFALAWPATVFAIAKRKDAAQMFKLVFRWFSLFLLFSAYCLSLVGIWLLNQFFPVAYHSAAFVIPIVAVSISFYGVYYVFKSGLDVRRKTWLISVYTTIAALINVALNFFLIPHYGAMGAAVSTLFAYIVLATIAYIVNCRIYPIPFEIGMFIAALLFGIALFVGSDFLAQAQRTSIAWSIRIGALLLYGVCLIVLEMFLVRSHQKNNGGIPDESIARY